MADTKYRCKDSNLGVRGVSGGVALRLVLCAVSLLVLGGAIFALMRTFEVRKADDYRKALSQSEIGLEQALVGLIEPPEVGEVKGGADENGADSSVALKQEAFAKFNASPDFIEEFKGEPDEDGANFSVVLKRENRGDTLFLKIVSTGTSGSVTQVKECTLRLEVSEENGSVRMVNEGIR